MGDLTKIDPVKAGAALTAALATLQIADETEKQHGALTGGLQRIQAQNALAAALTADAKALIVAGGIRNLAYEVAGDLSDQQKIDGVMTGLQRGYLIGDPRGNHFSLVTGKGGATMMPKEMGYRHQLEQKGATNIDCQAVSMQMIKRENDKAKQDMIVCGWAACEIGKTTYRVERSKEFPMRLPCHHTDGPDGHEAKGRRRLMRDLWQKISGIREVAETDDSADVVSAEMAQVNAPDHLPDASKKVPEPASVDWAGEFKRYGVTEQGVLLRDAPTQADRDSILAAAKAQVGDGIEYKAFDCLVRYAATKETE